MILRMSSLFVRTLREDPADAEVPSHKLLVRAGYVRRAAPGIYSWLPLGYLTYRNVENVVRDEMNAAGFQEVHFPALLPREPYEATGRWTEYGDNLFRLKDRKGNDMLLGPTHEEMFTLLVKDLYSSYKDFPLSLYQIQTKYRDEARPRAGILRGREFVMKDSYSFDVSDEDFLKSYEIHREAYIRIFNRLGFDYAIVAAMSGAMGGSASEEFLAVAEYGEDTFVRSPAGYAANVEAVRSAVPEPITATPRSCHRRVRYSVITSSGFVTTMTTRGSAPASTAVATESITAAFWWRTSSRLSPGFVWWPAVITRMSSRSTSSIDRPRTSTRDSNGRACMKSRARPRAAEPSRL